MHCLQGKIWHLIFLSSCTFATAHENGACRVLKNVSKKEDFLKSQRIASFPCGMWKESEHNDTNTSQFILKWPVYIFIKEPWAFQMKCKKEINNSYCSGLSFLHWHCIRKFTSHTKNLCFSLGIFIVALLCHWIILKWMTRYGWHSPVY